jgi:hypothetical protein
MSQMTKVLSTAFRTVLLIAIATAFSTLAQAAHHEEADADMKTGSRAMTLQAEAVVTAIDLESHQVSLEDPDGNVFTVNAREHLVKLEDVKIGDRLVVTYVAALETELREPTEEELAEPWVVLEKAGMSADAAHPGAVGARVIRAVVTIEGMDRELGVVTIKDSRGKLHIIGDVEPEKMEGVTLGQTAVMVYSEAVAISLEKKEAAAE